MNATIEDALVNWYETERSARWAATEARRSDIVHIGAARCEPSETLNGLFHAVEDALDTLSMRPFAVDHSAALAPLQAGLRA